MGVHGHQPFLELADLILRSSSCCFAAATLNRHPHPKCRLPQDLGHFDRILLRSLVILLSKEGPLWRASCESRKELLLLWKGHPLANGSSSGSCGWRGLGRRANCCRPLNVNVCPAGSGVSHIRAIHSLCRGAGTRFPTKILARVVAQNDEPENSELVGEQAIMKTESPSSETRTRTQGDENPGAPKQKRWASNSCNARTLSS